jgi:glutamine synthetase
VDLLAQRACIPPGPSSWNSSFSTPNAAPTARCNPPATCWTAAAISHKTEVYSVDHLHGMLPLFSDIYAGAEKAGIKAETLISEYAPGQYELTLHYRDRCDAGRR